MDDLHYWTECNFGRPSRDLSGGGKKGPIHRSERVPSGLNGWSWWGCPVLMPGFTPPPPPPGNPIPPGARWWMSWLMERIHARQICPLNNQSQHCSVINNFLGSPRTLSKAEWSTDVNTIRSVRDKALNKRASKQKHIELFSTQSKACFHKHINITEPGWTWLFD